MLGVAACFITILDMNTTNVCIWLGVHQLEQPIRQVRVIASCVEDHAIMYFPILILTLTFGFPLMHKLKLYYINMAAAFADTIYRFILYMFGVYDLPWKSFISNVLVLAIMTVNGYTLAKYFYSMQRERVKFVLLLSLSSVVIIGIPVGTFYVLVPIYIKLDGSDQLLVASASPILASIAKVCSRISVQRLGKVVHPGRLYILSAFVYIGSTILFRTLQANIESTLFFSLLCLGHGNAKVIGVMFLLVRKRVLNFVFRCILRRESYDTTHGRYKTPKVQRYCADLAVVEMMNEYISILYCNAMVQLYPLIFVKNVDRYEKIMWDFFLRCLIASVSECIFNVVSIFLSSWHLNVPLVKLWRMKWKEYLLVTASFLPVIIFFCTHYLLDIVHAKVTAHDQHSNSTQLLSCNASSLVFFR